MKQAIILHGTESSPEGNWFGWLEKKLRAHGFTVWLPQLPHAQRPSLCEWLHFVQKKCPFEIDADTVIVGHSSGAVLALLIAQESKMRVKSVICVSVFTDQRGENAATVWLPNQRLFDLTADWGKIKTHAKQIICVHSDDDPYIPVENAGWVAKQVSAEFIVIPGQGHFNLEKNTRFKTFPVLLKVCMERNIV